MQQFQYLIPDGNAYRIKNFLSFHHLIIFAWLLIGLAVLRYSDNTKTGIIIILLAILFIVLSISKTSKTKIYPSENILQVSVSNKNKFQDKYSFDSIQGFELQVIRAMLLPFGSYLYITAKDNNGKVSKLLISGSLGKKKMQQLSNELNHFFNIKDHGTT